MYAWPSYHLAWLFTLILLTVFLYTCCGTDKERLLNKGFSRGRSRADLGEGCKGYAPLPPMTFGFLIWLVFCGKRKKTMWFIGVEVKQAVILIMWLPSPTSFSSLFSLKAGLCHSLVVCPLLRKILNPPRHHRLKCSINLFPGALFV